MTPGDERLALHGEVDGFPYAGIEGRRSFVRIEDGKVWDATMAPEDIARMNQAAGGSA